MLGSNVVVCGKKHLIDVGVSSPILTQDQKFDVLVIGGGINGVAIARECAQWSKRTLLVEQNDFSS